MHALRGRWTRAGMSAVLLCVLASPRAAVAENILPAPESNQARAEQLFHDAVKLFDSGALDEACRAFADSLKLDPELGTLLNLALCHEKQGRTATAWSEFTHGAAWATQNGQTDRRQFANEHAISLEARLSRVLIALPPARVIGTIEVDGEPLPEPRWFLPLFLDPGIHTIASTAPGKIRRAETLHVPSGPSTQTFTIRPLDDLPVDRIAKDDDASAPLETHHDTRRIVGVSTLAVGIVGLGVGTAFGVAAIAKRNDIGAQCVADRCTEEGASTRTSAKHDASISTIAFAAGAGLSVIGTWLSFGPRSRSHAAQTPHVAIAPAVWINGGALQVGGAW